MLTRNAKRNLHDYFDDTDSQPPLQEDSLPPPAKKTKKYPKIFDRKFYSIQNDINGNIEAICSVCNEVKKGNFLSTGNFINHFNLLRHNDKLDELKLYTREIKPSQTQQTLLHMSSSIGPTPDIVCNSLFKKSH